MNPVRRLIFDFPPLWVALVVFMTLMVLLLDAMWLWTPRFNMPLIIAFVLGPPLTGLWTAKVPVWRLLPITQRQIARAQWWLAIGGPMLAVVACVGLAAGLLAATGHLRATSSQALTLAGGQLTAAIAFPLILAAMQKLSGRFGMAIGVATGIMVMAVLWGQILPIPDEALRLPAWIGTAISLIAAIWLFFRERPLVPEILMFRRAGEAKTPKRPAKRLMGWASLTAGYGQTVLYAVVGSVMAFMISWWFADREGPVSMILPLILFSFIPMAHAMAIRMSVRALRLASVSAWALTARLQLIGAVTTAAPALAVWLTARLVGAPSEILAIAGVLVIGVGACVQVLMLRINSMMMFGLTMPFLMLVVLPLSTLAAEAPSTAPWILAGGGGAFIVGWLATWLELSRGHLAYRAWPLMQFAWRGQGA